MWHFTVRVAHAEELKPLTAIETAQYIENQLEVMSLPKPVIPHRCNTRNLSSLIYQVILEAAKPVTISKWFLDKLAPPPNEEARMAAFDEAAFAQARQTAATLHALIRATYGPDAAGRTTDELLSGSEHSITGADGLPRVVLNYPSRELSNGHTLSLDSPGWPTVQLGHETTLDGMRFPAGTVFQQSAGIEARFGRVWDSREINLPNGVEISGSGIAGRTASLYKFMPPPGPPLAGKYPEIGTDPFLRTDERGRLIYTPDQCIDYSKTIRFPRVARIFSTDRNLRLLLNARRDYPRTVALSSVVNDALELESL